MRVVIANITGGHFSGGYAKYLRQTIPLMLTQPNVEIVMFNPAGSRPLFDGRIPEHQMPGRGVRRRLMSEQPDVLYIPVARHLRLPGVPTVIMVHNMEPLARPFGGNPPLECFKNIVRRQLARRAAERADRVIVVSRYVRDWLAENWDVPQERMALIYHGSDPPLPQESAARPPGVPEPPFLFTAGSIRPARGLDDLVGALRALRTDGITMPLLVAGRTTPDSEGYLARLRRRVEAEGLQHQVHWLGQLDEAGLAWCRYHCSAFIMTTRSESISITAIEAMAYGLPLIATDRPPLPEVCGDAATYYPPGDGAALASRIREALALTPAQRAQVAARGRRRAAEFQWAVTAERVLAQLRRAAAEGQTRR